MAMEANELFASWNVEGLHDYVWLFVLAVDKRHVETNVCDDAIIASNVDFINLE